MRGVKYEIETPAPIYGGNGEYTNKKDALKEVVRLRRLNPKIKDMFYVVKVTRERIS
jgi:hypothetical protein